MERDPQSYTQEVGRRLTRRRRLLGLRQLDIANSVGLSRGHVSQLELGHIHTARLLHIALLAEVLGTSTDYLLCVSDTDPGLIPPSIRLMVAYCDVSTAPPSVSALPGLEAGLDAL